MRPETWLPTCTVTSADSAPVAVTRPVEIAAFDARLLQMKGRLVPAELAPNATHPPPTPTTATRPTTNPTRRLTLLATS